ncbi:PREDICTED: opioid growth factor receptor-like protein 1 [Nanorana parkeri]|uniref:opioid growth factor receptor-like protein 1 n=1 Tax=Nanorana parkeri TaxID=125878 RepID=UPI0008544DDB|nr:PREDICTED: opioid growth factor receptor-like protein 1 [Nanorana parkeri]
MPIVGDTKVTEKLDHQSAASLVTVHLQGGGGMRLMSSYGYYRSDDLVWDSEYDSTWEDDEDYKLMQQSKPKKSCKRSWNRAAEDLQHYRHGYPKEMANLMFYRNEMAFVPNGVCIEYLHKNWKHDYYKLESNHSYIQWLFPLQEPGMNNCAVPLTEKEIEEMKKDKEVMKRFLESYKLMLGFYGIKLEDTQTGKLARANNWKEGFSNLNNNTHNNLRITRILKCLGELGYEHFQAPLVKLFLEETLCHGKLKNVKQSVLDYFMFTVKNKSERKKLVLFAYENYTPQEKFAWGPVETLQKLRPPAASPVAKSNNQLEDMQREKENMANQNNGFYSFFTGHKQNRGSKIGFGKDNEIDGSPGKFGFGEDKENNELPTEFVKGEEKENKELEEKKKNEGPLTDLRSRKDNGNEGPLTEFGLANDEKNGDTLEESRSRENEENAGSLLEIPTDGKETKGTSIECKLGEDGENVGQKMESGFGDDRENVRSLTECELGDNRQNGGSLTEDGSRSDKKNTWSPTESGPEGTKENEGPSMESILENKKEKEESVIKSGSEEDKGNTLSLASPGSVDDKENEKPLTHSELVEDKKNGESLMQSRLSISEDNAGSPVGSNSRDDREEGD